MNEGLADTLFSLEQERRELLFEMERQLSSDPERTFLDATLKQRLAQVQACIDAALTATDED